MWFSPFISPFEFVSSFLLRLLDDGYGCAFPSILHISLKIWLTYLVSLKISASLVDFEIKFCGSEQHFAAQEDDDNDS